ncbi:hypothetical protein H3Z74_22700 [Sphingomonas alpina]|uniref:Uncharacterized protein n=2 Tax=Sphingomonas alpina TaxID=653931 RepID=A0A7H0LR89_9SPHN|nr:hypothetical protein H3Z74_22700 [Sphingomonas alpina]
MDARLWQWTGLLQRALDQHEAALQSFGQAVRLAPSDVSIARGHAQVTFEAGLDAIALFERACRLAPMAGDMVLGLAAARMAMGRGEEAAAALDTILIRSPMWIEGHTQLAQLRSMLGQPQAVETSLMRALAAQPGESALWYALFDLHLRREDYATLADRVNAAEKAGQADPFCAEYRAIAAAELGDEERADTLFDVASAMESKLAIWRIRHLLRSGRAEWASRLIDNELMTERATAVWPYAAATWRLTGDSRGEWLENDSRFVTVMDLERNLPPLEQLAALLRSLHVAKGEYLDQSVRGGTQTDGPLLSRIEPIIRTARDAITQAVTRYIAQLPPPDPSHPLLAGRRDRRVRFAGSWSVRLAASGHHSNHVHPQGWISSALYVSLPRRQPDESAHAGWLVLGEPPAALGLDLPPRRMIEPREGQLILFPSWMWHGTRRFAQGERLTIAFDVAPPR